MPLYVLPDKFQSFLKIVIQLDDLEKMDLYNGPIPGKTYKNTLNVNMT